MNFYNEKLTKDFTGMDTSWRILKSMSLSSRSAFKSFKEISSFILSCKEYQSINVLSKKQMKIFPLGKTFIMTKLETYENFRIDNKTMRKIK